MVVGTRQKTIGGSAYRNDPLYPYAKAVTEAAHNILVTESKDLFAEPQMTMYNEGAKEALKEFFCSDIVDPNRNLSAEEIEEAHTDMENMFENDIQAMNENTYMASYSPMVGLATPIHKLILMNNVFSQGGGIQTVTAVAPNFPISQERRYLITPTGEKIDMFLEQNRITDAIEATAPTVSFDVTLPQLEGATDFIGQLGGTTNDTLSMTSHVAGVYVENVFFAEGDHLPDADGWFTNKGEIATAETAGAKNVWFHVNIPFTPSYGGPDRNQRIMNQAVTIRYKKDADGTIETLKDTLFGTLNDGKVAFQTLTGKITKIRFAAKLDTSNAQLETVSTKWDVSTQYVEIPEATPINTTVSPEEVKDIAAMYDANQVTKVMSMTKTVLSEYKDMRIKRFLDDSFVRLDDRNSFSGEFDFAPPEGYALDWVTHRHATFLDYFDDLVTQMLQAYNDPNMTVTIYGDPRIVRKITPTEYTYQAPANIGPVQLDYTQTIVDTKDHRVYNFVGSDKLRNTNELMVILNPKNTQRICYRIYNYQLYISNEIRNAANPSLPAIHAFERWLPVEYFPVQARVQILNPSGKRN
jgi:hypothetical protein